MTRPLLLDEMLRQRIASQLAEDGHDVRAAVLDPALLGLPDDQLLGEATRQDRSLVTLNIKDFVRLDAQCRAAGQAHAGLVLVSTKTFPLDSRFVGAVVQALGKLLAEPARLGPDLVVFLQQ